MRQLVSSSRMSTDHLKHWQEEWLRRRHLVTATGTEGGICLMRRALLLPIGQVDNSPPYSSPEPELG